MLRQVAAIVVKIYSVTLRITSYGPSHACVVKSAAETK